MLLHANATLGILPAVVCRSNCRVMQRSDQPVGGPEFMVDGIADVGIAVAIGEELACVSPPLFSADGTEGRPRAGLSECPGPAAPGGFPLFICAHARTHTHTHELPFVHAPRRRVLQL